MSSSTTTQLPDYQITQLPDQSPPPPIENQNSEIENPPSPAPLSSLPSFLHPGHLTLLLGEPGTGKSLLALDLAARLTTNSLPPPFPHHPRPAFAQDQVPEYAYAADYQPGTVIALSREDSFDTLASRLLDAGADRDFLALPQEPLSLLPEKPIPWDVPRGAYRGPTEILPATLLRYLNEQRKSFTNLRLLILDPLPAFLNDATSPKQIRSMLGDLLAIAEYRRFAVLGISHLNKSTHQKNILHRALGSQTYLALARSVYLLTHLTPGESPGANSPHAPTRLLIPIKTNLAPTTHALAFHITPNATLAWDQSPITDHPLLTNPDHAALDSPDNALAKSQLEFAIDFLHQTLQSGPLLSTALLHEARSLGISHRTFLRARLHLNIACHRDPEKRHWLSYLPNHDPRIPHPIDYNI